MSIGEIAGIIAALAFAVLVIFICINLSKLAKVMTDLKETVKRVNTTLDVVTKDVDNLSVEVEGLLNKANSLVDDVNGKLGKTDPLFTAIGDLGVTVSDLNDSTKNMTVNLLEGVGRKNKSKLSRFISATQNFSKFKPGFKDKTKSGEDSVAEDLAEAYEEDPSLDQTDLLQTEDQLKTFIKEEPSRTAGEIRIK